MTIRIYKDLDIDNARQDVVTLNKMLEELDSTVIINEEHQRLIGTKKQQVNKRLESLNHYIGTTDK